MSHSYPVDPPAILRKDSHEDIVTQPPGAGLKAHASAADKRFKPMPFTEPSELRVNKHRADAVVTLTNGTSTVGVFFVAEATPTHLGLERVAELLNSETGFFPFEIRGIGQAHTVMYNRRHVVMVAVSDEEARRDPGYELATERKVSVLLSNGQHIVGSIRVYRPKGHDRLSDWARDRDHFQYIEAPGATVIVNLEHVVEAREVFER